MITERLVVRAPQDSDRAGFCSLLTSSAARRFLGGPLTLDVARAATGGPAGQTPGSFAVTHGASGAFLGTVTLDRRDPDRPGHLRPEGLELEISYVLDPAHWGQGFATEAVVAALAWAATLLSDRHVVACTQTANSPSVALLERLGFTEIDRFVEFDAAQGLWRRSLTDQEDASNGSR